MARIIDSQTGELLDPEPSPPFEILDIYGAPAAPAAPRVDWLATISAGSTTTDRNGREIPSVVRDGMIQLHDPEQRAPALAEILAREGGRRLTIALASDNLADVIQQRYVRYSASSVEVFGDGEALTLLAGGKRETVSHGTAAYEEVRATCKVAWSLFFCLARWSGTQSQVLFPDGFGQYRLRSASRNSLLSVVGKLMEIQRLTGGRLMGIPLELAIAYRDVAGPDGKRRNVPVWTLALRPPEAIQLTSGNFRQLIGAALREGEALRLLPAPTPASIDEALEAFEGEPDADVEQLAQAQTVDVRCDAEHYRRVYFAMSRNTEYETDAGRAAFVTKVSRGRTSSLAEFLAVATEAEANALIAALAEEIEKLVTAERRERLADPPAATGAPSEPSAPAGGDAPELATDDQIRALRRLLSPGQQRDVNWETLTRRDAADWIVSSQN